jgi:frataxin-like iron-binding protein CyaY
MKEIEQLEGLFRDAHNGTSFSPEVRAKQCVKDFSEELASDLEQLGEKAGGYSAKYVQHLRSWITKKSRCLSPMIAGPANFPAARNRKAFNSEQKSWEEFREWRERYFKAVTREKIKSPEEEIDDALVNLEKQRNTHTMMIEVNKIMRKKISDEEKKASLLYEHELSEKMVERIMQPDFLGRQVFSTSALTNSNARIKALEEKVLTMKARIVRRDAFEAISFEGGKIDIQDDRVVIIHDEKPGSEVVAALKSKGFHWSPRNKFWCRKHTARALIDAKSICGVV